MTTGWIGPLEKAAFSRPADYRIIWFTRRGFGCSLLITFSKRSHSPASNFATVFIARLVFFFVGSFIDMHPPEYRHIPSERLNAMDLAIEHFRKIHNELQDSRLFSPELLARFGTVDALIRRGAGHPMEPDEFEMVSKMLLEQLAKGRNRY